MLRAKNTSDTCTCLSIALMTHWSIDNGTVAQKTYAEHVPDKTHTDATSLY